MKNVILALFLIFAFILSYRCTDNANTAIDCTGVVATYSTTVQNILDNSCAYVGCHDTKTSAGALNLSTYALSKKYLDSPTNRFLCTINHSSGCETVHAGLPKFDAANLKTLTCWYNNGYPQ